MTDRHGIYGAGTDAILRVVPAPLPFPPTTKDDRMFITITEDRTRVSLDGTHVITLDEGTEVEVADAIGESLIKQGRAKEREVATGPDPVDPAQGAPEPAPALAAAAVPPAAPEDTTVAHAAAQGELVPGGDLPAAPPANASRATCDTVALELGIDPSVYHTRDEVRDAIIARLEGLARAQA